MMSPPPPHTLPVLLKLISSYKLWQQYFDSIPKSKRHTIAGKIDLLFIELIESLSMGALSPRAEKIQHLKLAITKLDCLKIFLNVAWEIKVLDDRRYIALSSTLTEPGKMIGGWHKELQTTHLNNRKLPF